MKPQSKRKTTFTVRESTLVDFVQACDRIGLRRDTYLNRVLPKAISLFDGSPKRNSPEAAKISKILRENEKGALKKLVVSLESLVLQDLNVVCREKLVSRDIFFEEVLNSLLNGSPHGFFLEDKKINPFNEDNGATRTLKSIANRLYDPWSGWIPHDESRRHDPEEILGFIPTANPKGGPGEDSIPGPVKPTYNMSPFDSILFGDIPMKQVLAIAASSLDQLITVLRYPEEL